MLYNPSNSVLIPIFPLHLVLFPKEPLPLHIFEPRYKQMIGECLAENKPFGIAFFEGEEIKIVGTTALATHVFHTYDDGRMDILTLGQKRFKILGFNTEKPYLQAHVRYFDDPSEPSSPEYFSLLRETLEAYKVYLAKITQAQTVEASFDPPYRQVSYRMALSIKNEPALKQRLLEITNEEERLGALNQFFRRSEKSLYQRYPWLEQIRSEFNFSKN